jgi:hypothetical protein
MSERDGIVNEVYYPSVDQANTRDLGLLVAEGADRGQERARPGAPRGTLDSVPSGPAGVTDRSPCQTPRRRIAVSGGCVPTAPGISRRHHPSRIAAMAAIGRATG